MGLEHLSPISLCRFDVKYNLQQFMITWFAYYFAQEIVNAVCYFLSPVVPPGSWARDNVRIYCIHQALFKEEVKAIFIKRILMLDIG